MRGFGCVLGVAILALAACRTAQEGDDVPPVTGSYAVLPLRCGRLVEAPGPPREWGPSIQPWSNLEFGVCGELRVSWGEEPLLAEPGLRGLGPLPFVFGLGSRECAFSPTSDLLRIRPRFPSEPGLGVLIDRETGASRDLTSVPGETFAVRGERDSSLLLRCHDGEVTASGPDQTRPLATGVDCVRGIVVASRAPVFAVGGPAGTLLVGDAEAGTLRDTALPLRREWGTAPSGAEGFREDKVLVTPDGRFVFHAESWMICVDDECHLEGPPVVTQVNPATGAAVATHPLLGGSLAAVEWGDHGLMWVGDDRRARVLGPDGIVRPLGTTVGYARIVPAGRGVVRPEDSGLNLWFDFNDLERVELGVELADPVLSENGLALAGCRTGDREWCAAYARFAKGGAVTEFDLPEPAVLLWVGDDGKLLFEAEGEVQLTAPDGAVLLQYTAATGAPFGAWGEALVAGDRLVVRTAGGDLSVVDPATASRVPLAEGVTAAAVDPAGERVAWVAPGGAGETLWAGALPR